jgi:hypothetical protein
MSKVDSLRIPAKSVLVADKVQPDNFTLHSESRIWLAGTLFPVSREGFTQDYVCFKIMVTTAAQVPMFICQKLLGKFQWNKEHPNPTRSASQVMDLDSDVLSKT